LAQELKDSARSEGSDPKNEKACNPPGSAMQIPKAIIPWVELAAEMERLGFMRSCRK